MLMLAMESVSGWCSSPRRRTLKFVAWLAAAAFFVIAANFLFMQRGGGRLGIAAGSGPAASPLAERVQNATTSSSISATAPTSAYNDVPRIVAEAIAHGDPFAVNELRRKLYLSGALDGGGDGDGHFDPFAEAFLSRHRGPGRPRHLTLHVPKTGGTSVCDMAKAGGMSTSGNRCWKRSHCPVWCCCDGARPTTCEDLANPSGPFASKQMVMNENYFDGFCTGGGGGGNDTATVGRAYSVLTREPIARAISHVNHLSKGRKWLRRNTTTLCKSNYMTWSLSARYSYAARNTSRPQDFRPRKRHLQIAMETLRKFDFIVDLSSPDKECTSLVLQWMGLLRGGDGNETLAHSNSRTGTYESAYKKTDFRRANHLDVELYRYSTSLLEADCKFLRRLGESGHPPPPPLPTPSGPAVGSGGSKER